MPFDVKTDANRKPSKNPLRGLVGKPPKTYQQYLSRRRKRGLVGAVTTKAQFEYRSKHKPRVTGGRDQGPRFLGIPIYAEERLGNKRRKKR